MSFKRSDQQLPQGTALFVSSRPVGLSVIPRFQALPTKRILFSLRHKTDQEKEVEAWNKSKRLRDVIAEGEEKGLLQAGEAPSEIQTLKPQKRVFQLK